jgi:hypothetical protein
VTFALIALILGATAPVSTHKHASHSLRRGTRLTGRTSSSEDAPDVPVGHSEDGTELDEKGDTDFVDGFEGTTLAC